MKKLLSLMLLAAFAAGCTTVEKSKPDNNYAADVPPPLVKGDPQLADPSKALPPAKTRVSAATIDEQNVLENTAALEAEMRNEKRAVGMINR